MRTYSVTLNPTNPVTRTRKWLAAKRIIKNQLLRLTRKGYSIRWCCGFDVIAFEELARMKVVPINTSP
jgi:hypothetical protein